MDPRRTKGLRIATRCANVDDFVATFHRQCGERSFFIATTALRDVGFETAFSLDLVDKSPALRGVAVVDQAWSTSDNPFGRPGMQFAIRKLTATSERVFEQLRAARASATAVPTPQEEGNNTDITTLPLAERTPGSELVLPANPLAGIPDSSLGGFIECTLYEETGSFFRVEPEAEPQDDPPADPPLLAPLVPRARSPVEVEPDPAEPPEPPPEARRAPAATPPPLPIVARPPPPPLPEPAPVPVPVPAPAPAPPPVPVVAAPTPPRAPLAVRAHASSASRRWLLPSIAAAAVALVALVIVIVSSGSSSADDPPPQTAAASKPSPSPLPPLSPSPQPTPPPPPTPAPPSLPAAATVDPSDEPRDPSAPPQIGSGPCKLVVTSTPAGSVVSLDGEAVGPTPIAIAGPCQHRKVDVAHPRYQTATRTVALADGTPTSIDVALQRPQHKVMVETQPSGATISIAGKRAGQSPTAIQVLGFTSIELAITKPGYLPVTKHLYSKTASDHVVVRLVKSMSR